MKIPLINMILFFIAVQAMLVLINTHDINSPATLFPSNINSTNSTSSGAVVALGYTSNAIWDTIMFPQLGTRSSLFYFLLAMAGAIAAISLLARVDTGIWAGMFVLLLGVGSVPISNLYNFINSEVGRFACSSLGSGIICWPGQFAAMLFCGILSIFWVWGCISWWSNRYD
jgi:hypothetical protein